mgnify:CR=1 FL=1
MTPSRSRILRRALAQGLVVGFVTFVLILGVEYIWAGGLVDLRLYVLASAGVSVLVFLIIACSQRHGENRHTTGHNPPGRGY